MKKAIDFIKKFCTKEVILYLVFGVLTTLVNIGVYSILSSFFHVEENLSSNIGIILAVLFAYFTNRKLVFHSSAVTNKEKFLEFGKFILGRAFTMIVESVGFWLLFTILKFDIWDGLASKLLITVIVIVLNFFISKFFAFKK